MTVFSDSTSLKAAVNQVSADLGGQSVILDLKASFYYGLNEVAAQVWNLLQKPITVGELQTWIVDHYAVTPEQCRHDLHELLGQLLEKGLIEIDEETAR